MKIIKKKNKHAISAQGMVEFALALPILMLLVVGMMEVGRLVFVYITISSASREAVRYGSATGGIDKFKDCAGIRQAAWDVNFLRVFDETDIEIEYFHGLDTTPFATCPVGATTWDGGNTQITSGDRIRVRISGDFAPVVGFVPLISRTRADGNPITSTNYHTLLGSVAVPLYWVNAGEGGGGPFGGDVFPLDNIDRCPYKEGIIDPTFDATIPSGMAKDANGNCFTIPLDGDYCPNIPGKQKDFPSGWIVLPNGDCADPTEYDYCTNIPDVQSALPDLMNSTDGICSCPTHMEIQNAQCVCSSGYILENGECVVNPDAPTPPPLEDLCPNLGLPDWPDINNPIPPGYIKENGICIEIPQCTFSHNGSVPSIIAVGEKTTQTSWIINNTSFHPLNIDSIYITWDDTDSHLYLSQVNFGNNITYTNNNNVSGYYYPIAGFITIPANSSLYATLSFSYNRVAPNSVNVASKVSVMFNQVTCKFDNQPTCTFNNELRSDCAAQHQ